jgi:hypothetical protein
MSTQNATNTAKPITVAQGGSGDSSLTAYAVVCGGTTSTGALQSVSGVGTSGQVLTSNGAAALPTWQNSAAGGNLVLLQSQTASSSASLTFSTGVSSTYNTYFFLFSAVVPATNTAILGMTLTGSGGSYAAGTNYFAYNSATVNNINSASNILIGGALSNTASIGVSGSAYGYGMTSGTSEPSVCGQVVFNSSALGTTAFGLSTGLSSSVSTITAFVFQMSSGNISTGTITVFGVLE